MNTKAKRLQIKTSRPAAVLVVDLVKYSMQDKDVKRTVQKVMESVFQSAIHLLKLDDVHFNYTGDGYFCAFLGDSSVRVLDFINHAFPELKTRLSDCNQQFRAGLDYGIVQSKHNALTTGEEVAGIPGIIATRLQEAAGPNGILCSETVRNIFAPNFPEMFSAIPQTVKSKDRPLSAYEIVPLDSNKLQSIFLQLVAPTKMESIDWTTWDATILVVDDEEWLREIVALAVRSKFPRFKVLEAANGEEALEVYKKNKCDLLLVDINMEKMDGFTLTEAVIKLNPQQAVIIITGLADQAGRRRSFALGAIDFIPKPFTIDVLCDGIGNAVANHGAYAERRRLTALSDDAETVFCLIRDIASRYKSLLSKSEKRSDLANTMLRHKAKQVVRDFAGTIRLGNDIIKGLTIVRTQLDCVSRLSNAIDYNNVGTLNVFVDRFFSDLIEMYPKVKFSLERDNQYLSIPQMPCKTVIVLIMSELIDNAISAMKGRGTIATAITTLTSANTLRIVVKDSGPGIPTKLREKAFEEGMSTKGEGRGLGLWLIRESLRSLGGDIFYEYENGSTFCVKIPIE